MRRKLSCSVLLVFGLCATSLAQQWPPPGVVRAGDPGVTAPRPLSRVEPQYTPSAMRAKIEGSVRLQVIVNADGTVRDVRVERSLDRTHGLDDEAVTAAKRWTFTPGSMKGRAVPVLVWMELTFNLTNDTQRPAAGFELRLAEYEPTDGFIVATLDDGRKIYVGPMVATSNEFVESHVVEDGPDLSIVMTFDERAAKRLFASTVDHVGRPLVFVVKGEIYSAPLVNRPVANPVKIDGMFTREEADALVRELNR